MARAYSTLGDVIEQLRQNNQTNVDINEGIAGLENMFGKFFADLKRTSLEDKRESGKGKAADQTSRASGSPRAQKSGGGLLSGLGSIKNLGFIDSWREQNPDENSIYSWFDYRSRMFNDNPKRGLRIDHILVAKELSKSIKFTGIDYEARAMEKPSDHCPVWVEIS